MKLPYSLQHKRIPLALLVVWPLAGWAQGYTEAASLSTELLPLPSGGPDPQPTAWVSITRANVIVPHFLKQDKSEALLLGVGGEFLSFTGSRPDFAVQHLYSLAPVLGYTRQLTPELRLTGLFIPALSSDYQRVAGKDVQYSGLVRGVYRVKPALALRAVLGYRQTFYGPTYIVLGGVDWQVSERVRIFGDVPANLTVAYAVTPRVNAGLDLVGAYTTYRLSLADEYVRYRTFLVGLFGEYYVQPKLALRAKVGYSLIRNLETYRQGNRATAVLDFVSIGDSPAPISPAVSKGLAVQVALSYRLPTAQPAK